MYAIIETGGKQYRVTPGQTLDVERLSAAEDAEITFDRVLMVGDGSDVQVGQPLVSGATVTARVVTEHKGDKVIVFKYKPKTRYRRFKGHRQTFTRITVGAINLPEKQ